jgi:hypothetical protein
MKFNTFIADRRTVDALVRNLMIIGEAAVHVPEVKIRTAESTSTIRPPVHHRYIVGNGCNDDNRSFFHRKASGPLLHHHEVLVRKGRFSFT